MAPQSHCGCVTGRKDTMSSGSLCPRSSAASFPATAEPESRLLPRMSGQRERVCAYNEVLAGRKGAEALTRSDMDGYML